MELAVFAKKWYKGKDNVFAASRVTTFGNWPFDSEAPCSVIKVAEAGFVNTTAKKSAPCAACAFCSVELEFEEEDDPWQEHVKRGQNCEFVTLNKLDESTWTVRDYMELLGAAHVNVEAKRYTEDYENIRLAGEEVKAMSIALKKK